VAFGQPAGPPASFRQIEELTSLLHDAGHSDFRDARGPMGFTQRQSGGRFTRDEASAYIERLQRDASEQHDASDGSGPAAAPSHAPPAAPSTAPSPRAGEALRRMTSDQLAAELVRRGWRVQGPVGP
jgi:hypothetical protein